jgi:two-component system, OmpR family, response regulator VanR
MANTNLKVLYIEDEKELREIVAQILSLKISNLYLAEDGEEAFRLYQEIKPDIIVADINLPKINGIDFIKKVRENDHSTRVIMLTAKSDVECLLEATELKLTRYLIKPTTNQDIFDAIDLAIEELDSFNITNTQSFILNDEYSWDFKEMVLLYKKNEVHLTPKEKQVLNMLFSNINSTITYDMLLYEVWGDNDIFGIDTIKTTVKTLRKKLPIDTILNVYGIGFKVKG